MHDSEFNIIVIHEEYRMEFLRNLICVWWLRLIFPYIIVSNIFVDVKNSNIFLLFDSWIGCLEVLVTNDRLDDIVIIILLLLASFVAYFMVPKKNNRGAKSRRIAKDYEQLCQSFQIHDAFNMCKSRESR